MLDEHLLYTIVIKNNPMKNHKMEKIQNGDHEYEIINLIGSVSMVDIGILFYIQVIDYCGVSYCSLDY